MRSERIGSLLALSGLVLVPLLLALLAAPAVRATPPPIGEEIRIDHGFRYPYRVYEGTTAAIAVSDSTVLLAWGEEYGYRISALRTDLVGGGAGDSNVVGLGVGTRFDLANPDALGWKIVQTGESDELIVRNLEATSLRTTMQREIDPPGGAPLLNAEIEAAAGFHVIAWMEGSGGYDLRLARVTPDLELLGDPITVAPAPAPTMDLTMNDERGLIAYVNASFQTSIVLLGSDGLPALGPFILGSARSWAPQVACCSSVVGWIVAWSGASGLRLAFVDPAGAILPPGVLDLGEFSWAGLSLAEGPDGVAYLAWRPVDWGTLLGVRIFAGVGVGNPVHLHDDSPYEWYGQVEDRNLSCAWTGGCFAVLWPSMHVPPVAARDGVRTPASLRHDFGDYPVRSHWIAHDGGFLYPSPRIATQWTRPDRLVTSKTPAGHLAVMHDRATDEYIHVASLDAEGRPTRPAQRYRTPAEADDCGFSTCTSHRIGGLILRPWDEDAAAVYTHDYFFSNDLYSLHDGWLVIDRLRDDGSLGQRCRFRLVDDEFSLMSYDLALAGDRIFIAYTADEYAGDPEYGKALLADSTGATLREWSVASPHAVSGIAVASLPDGSGRFLCVWAEDGSLRRAIADPERPGDALLGLPFAGDLDAERGAALVDGPDQLLCVFPARADGAYEVQAVRFDASGLPLDPVPIVVSRLPVDPRNARGVWDGYQYLVAWESSDYPASVVYGNRMDRSGAVYDGDGLVIGSGAWCAPHLASDDAGHILIAYGRDRVRRIDDMGPLVEAPDQPTAAGGRALAGARLATNPTRGVCRLAAPLPAGTAMTAAIFDPSGRRIASRRVDGDAGDRTLLWDGRLPDGRRAPTGAYLVRVSANGQDIVLKCVVLR